MNLLRAFPGYTLGRLEQESSRLLRYVDIVAAGTPDRHETDEYGSEV